MNTFVDLLLSYQSFSPVNDPLYSEKATDALDFHTNALDFLKSAVEQTTTKVVILTGDAGHGKTYWQRGFLLQIR